MTFDIKRTSGTDFLANAHRLPLEDETFDLVLSMQVLEHLHSPWIAVQEVARVLRPGGSFTGSVAFLKPYHGGSYYHMTHRGVMHLLASCGLEVDRIEGAQSLTHAVFGMRIPLGTSSMKRFVYGGFDALLDSLRARFWSWRTKMDPDRPTDRFATEGLKHEFQNIRQTPRCACYSRSCSQGEQPTAMMHECILFDSYAGWVVQHLYQAG